MPTFPSRHFRTFVLAIGVCTAGVAGCSSGSTPLAPISLKTAAPLPTPTPSPTPSLAPDSVRTTLSNSGPTTISVFPLNGISGTVTFAAPSPAVTGITQTMTITTTSLLGGSSLQPSGLRREETGAELGISYYSFQYTCSYPPVYNMPDPCYGSDVAFPPSLLFVGFSASDVPPGDGLFAAAFGPSASTPFSTEQIPLSNGSISYVPQTHIFLTNGDVYGYSLYAQAVAPTPTPSPSPSPTPTAAASGSGLANPVGLAVDSNNNLYAADSGNNRIVEFDDNGAPVSVDTTGVNDPGGITIDSSNDLWIANRGNATITEYVNGSINANNTILLPATGPSSVAVDANGYVFVGFNGSQPGIDVYATSKTAAPALISTVTMDGSGNAIVPGALALASYGGQEFVIVGNGSASPNNVTAYSAAQIEAQQPPAAAYSITAGISGPTGIAVNAKQTSLYVSDLYTGVVTVYSQSGSSVAQSGTISANTGYCGGVAVDSLGDVYVSNDGSLDDITEYNASGTQTNTISARRARR